MTVEFLQVAAWTKYWAALCGDQLYYYPAKSLKATERKHVGHTGNPSVPDHIICSSRWNSVRFSSVHEDERDVR